MAPLHQSVSFQLLSLLSLAPHSWVTAYDYTFNPLEHLGRASPYFEPRDVQPSSPSTPQGCTVARAAVLSRHGAINVNDDDFADWIQPFLVKFLNHTSTDWSSIPSMSFLANHTSPLTPDSEPELLTKIGELEATEFASKFAERYPNLKTPSKVWASSAARTYNTGKAFASGIETADHPIEVVKVNEGLQDGANNLIPWRACPEYREVGIDITEPFREKFAKPIKARFNALAPEYNFTTTDVVGMMLLCGYEAAIQGNSPFCSLDLFGPDDWLGWEYADDIRYNYDAGYGNYVAGPIAFPWVNATANLLFQETAEEDMYVSFTHRTLPSMSLAVLGLFNNTAFVGSGPGINESFPLDRINPHRAWRTSNLSPCLGNVVIEKLACQGSYGFDDGEYYRVLVNHAPQAIPDCSEGPGASCSRSGFEALLQEKEELYYGFSEWCQVDYDNSTDILTFYQHYP
ncbi:histidine acid phosphatase [Hypoxylon rubiginosum]|uniref:Histidine acid phosphatase n=1 Tax=Hypoxylon rubiginosum TaxID=110542 RepID=A0ACB9YJF1_9PEZI|nr:histidine acid phosphatase [Hypoxylon rubiginosum]